MATEVLHELKKICAFWKFAALIEFIIIIIIIQMKGVNTDDTKTD